KRPDPDLPFDAEYGPGVRPRPDRPDPELRDQQAQEAEAFTMLSTVPPGVIDEAVQHANPPFNGSEGGKVPGAVFPASRLPTAGREALERLLTRFFAFAERSRRETDPPFERQDVRKVAGTLVLEFWCNLDPRGLSGLHLSLIWDGKRMLDMPLAFASTLPAANPGSTPVGDPAPESPLEDRLIELPPGRYRHDRLLTLLAKAGGFEVVADYFTKGTVLTVEPGKKRLGDLLSKFDAALRCRHEWDGTLLRVRTVPWAELTDLEPPAEVTDRLEQFRALPRGPALEDLLLIARRTTDEQLATLEHYHGPGGEPLPLHLVPRLRMNAGWLRAFAALPAYQLADAESRAGLPLSRLAPGAREQWGLPLARAGLDPQAPALLRVLPGPPPTLTAWPRIPRVCLLSPLRPQPADLWRNAESY
ncbi:MAG TPA: hypothetical protein VFU47_15330, partial [Armatimonadota bacterium]|nr:hypothetical protein [Armatimonadota bacterium]